MGLYGAANAAWILHWGIIIDFVYNQFEIDFNQNYGYCKWAIVVYQIQKIMVYIADNGMEICHLCSWVYQWIYMQIYMGISSSTTRL